MPKNVKKKHLTKITCIIGEFSEGKFSNNVEKYAYHRMLLCLLGKHECKNLRNEVSWNSIII